jgi:hypothetical protein
MTATAGHSQGLTEPPAPSVSTAVYAKPAPVSPSGTVPATYRIR